MKKTSCYESPRMFLRELDPVYVLAASDPKGTIENFEYEEYQLV